MANDVPDFTRSVEVSAGTVNASITNAAIIVEPASGATFPISGTVNASITNSQIAVVPASGSTFNAHITDSAVTIQPASGATFPITGPVTIDTGGGPVYVNAAGTPLTQTLLAHQSSVALNTTGVVLYNGAIDTYESLLVSIAGGNGSWRLQLMWYDPTGSYGLGYTYQWDTTAGVPLVWQFPTPSPYVKVVVFGASGTSLTDVSIYGIRAAAPPPVLQASGPLFQGRNISVAAGSSYSNYIAPYVGQAILNVYNGPGTSVTVSVFPNDWLANPLGQCFYYKGTATVIHDFIALPPHINEFILTNNDTASHTYHFSVTAI
jgi:hypothetical protein